MVLFKVCDKCDSSLPAIYRVCMKCGGKLRLVDQWATKEEIDWYNKPYHSSIHFWEYDWKKKRDQI